MTHVLSQEEIDALLGGLSGGQIDTRAGAVKKKVPIGTVIPFDFADQDRFLPGRLPTLETIHDRFARLLRMNLSTSLRRPVEIQISNQTVCSFGDFTQTIEKPSSLHILRLEPYKGSAMLVLPARLILTLVDLMFGGDGKQIEIDEDRDFTLIENRLITKIAEDICRCYTESWSAVHPLQAHLAGSEVNVQFINIASPSDTVNVVDCEISVENNQATLSMCIPHTAIEPVKEILKGVFISEDLERDPTLIDRIQTNLMESAVELQANLGTATITGRELIRLKPGDIIQLNEDYEHPVEILVEGIRKFWGMVGAYKSNRALQITGIENGKGKKK
jgi:flagellar motor switch protein FliM